MAITINFAEKYANLKGEGIPARQAQGSPDKVQLPEGYGREWVHPENGFVNLFCK